MGAGLRPTLKCVELPPDPKMRAVPHPTVLCFPHSALMTGNHLHLEFLVSR